MYEDIWRLMADSEEHESWHNPYAQELREQESIRRGDVEALKKCWAETYDGEIGTLASDPLRNIKNLAIGVITLSSRSAISGGLNPETVFSVVDAVIFDIEQHMTRIEDVVRAIHSIQLMFAEQVRDSMNGKVYNPLVSKTKDYVFKHIHGKISVADIAEWLGINPDYLSALFKRCERKTITEYIMAEKIKMSCNMLKFSSYSIQRISAYFGFCSQSHFTAHFKKYMNMTPGRYRRMYAVEKFQK